MIGYRKFTVAVLFWASATALCVAGRLDGGQYVTLASWVMGLYGAANAAGKFGARAAAE